MKEEKSHSSGEGVAAEGNNDESDEEDANMIPDEKPDGAGAAGADETAIGDQTALEMDLMDQINQLDQLESDEKALDDEVR